MVRISRRESFDLGPTPAVEFGTAGASNRPVCGDTPRGVSYGRALVFTVITAEVVPDIRFINRGESSLDLLFQRRKIRDETMFEPFVEPIPASFYRVELR